MHHNRNHIFLGFMVIAIAFCTGCGFLQIKGLGTVFNKAYIEPVVEPTRALDRGANEFRLAKGRWPNDFAELSNYLKQSDSETFGKLQAVDFRHIKFSHAPNGWLKVTGPIAIVVPGGTFTDSGTTLTSSGETNTIHEMTIAPTDPSELSDRHHESRIEN